MSGLTEVRNQSGTTAASTTVSGASSYPQASLYVGDLHPDVQENLLFEKFSQIGPVLSIRICRDAISKKSLGYGYINYQSQPDAERAMEAMNFEEILGQPIRLMWSQRDPSLRRSGTGNVFIKNLDRAIDTKSLYDTFSTFGKILSCKIVVGPDGRSKGFGYVHFETDDVALHAISKVNGMIIQNKKVFVGRFKSRAQWETEQGANRKFTNVFIKNLGKDITQEEFTQLVSAFGAPLSVCLPTEESGKSKGYGFVAYQKPEDAAKAVEALNGKEEGGRKLYAGRAQKKEERHGELKQQYEAKKKEILQRSQGVNLYIKNLDDTITDEKIREEFNRFGNITSLKIMTEDREGRTHSRGFAFVCYSSPEEATKAVTEMNGKMLSSKPLYVALAQRKEERRAQLASQYMQKLSSMRMNSGAIGQMYTPNQQGYFAQANSYSQPVAGFMPTVRPPMGVPQAAPPPASRYAAGYASYPARYPQRGPSMPRVNYSQQAAARVLQHQGQINWQQGDYGTNGNYHFTPAVRNRPLDQQPATPAQYQHHQLQAQTQLYPRPDGTGQMVMIDGVGNNGNGIASPLPIASPPLANLSKQTHNEQKQVLGERIYPAVTAQAGTLSGKVAGMLLEMDNSEILILLENKQLLDEKISEALDVLKEQGFKQEPN